MASAAPAAASRRSSARDARRQLARAERLGDVVVGAELEPRDPLGLLAARRQHDDRDRRRRRIGAQRLADEQPVHARQHQIEDDRSGPASGRAATPPSPTRRSRRVPGLLQIVRDQIGDVVVVLDDQHAAHELRTPCAKPSRISGGVSSNAARRSAADAYRRSGNRRTRMRTRYRLGKRAGVTLMAPSA